MVIILTECRRVLTKAKNLRSAYDSAKFDDWRLHEQAPVDALAEGLVRLTQKWKMNRTGDLLRIGNVDIWTSCCEAVQNL